MMSLLPFLHRVKATTDGDKDDTSRVPSKPVRNKVHHLVC